MILQIYKDSILESIIKEQFQEKQNFILEENRNNRYGTKKQNIIQIWKKENGLKHYQNYLRSSDLSPIKNIWGTEKAYMRRFTHQIKEEMEELAAEAWNEGIN